MTKNLLKIVTSVTLLIALNITPLSVFAQDEQKPPFPDLSKGRGRGIRGAIPTDKLTPELRQLYAQFGQGSRGNSNSDANAVKFEFSERDLREIFGITNAKSGNPSVAVAVTVNNPVVISAINAIGMRLFMRMGNTLHGEVPVMALERIAEEKDVVKIAATKSAKTPELPTQNETPSFLEMGVSRGNGVERGARPNTAAATTATAPLANEFNKAGMTGKGIIVGVIDSGIDWRHKDFINPDGTTRILAIWDMFDDSFQTSGGKIGSAPPQLDPQGKSLFGTIYTREQINAALKGTGTVNTKDLNGHGTAVAGTAAGNGNGAVAPVTAQSVVGVAPEADLIVVRASECGSFAPVHIFGAAWMVQTAQTLKRPIVVNQSFGGHFSAHDGTEPEEQFLNQLTGKGKPGVIFTVSAGNEGRYSMHAANRFGAKRAGQADSFSSAITVNMPAERAGKGTVILGVFDTRDEWGVAFRPVGATALLDQNKQPLTVYVFKTGGELKYAVNQGQTPPAGFDELMLGTIRNSLIGTKKDVLQLGLPAGEYRLWGFGATERVTSGEFSLYAPSYWAAEFGMGTAKSGMVGSPGNAANAITVGAYNFRNTWANNEGGMTAYNFALGEISDYSSPGGKRKADGVVKPDIAAPATYTLSSLSRDAAPGSAACNGASMGASMGKKFVTADGNYIAWNGTSASSPFTAGVIALMLQKNPNLDAEQVRQILIKTARKDAAVGAVPNPAWGYGMIDPAAALAATPAVTAARPAPAKK